MLKIIIFILTIIFFFILINQNTLYHYFVSFPKLKKWLNKNNRKKIIEEKNKKIIKLGSTEKYFDSLPKNKNNISIVPNFDNSVLIKQEIPNQFSSKYFSKENSLPLIINMFTTPHTLFGDWIGDSIFRKDFTKRGNNNKYKEVYMEALQKNDIINYDKIINNKLEIIFKKKGKYNLFKWVQNLNIELTYLLHFGFNPNKDDYKDAFYFIEAIRTHGLEMEYIEKQIKNLPKFHKKILNYIEKCNNKNTIVGKWLIKGELSHQNIFMEFIHNILGMAINWTNLTYYYIINHHKGNITNIPEVNVNNYIYECFRYILPVRYITSFIKKPEIFNLPNKSKNLAIHDLKVFTHNTKFFGNSPNLFLPKRMENSKIIKSQCPFSQFFNSPKGAKVACGMEILEKEGYIPFGEGYRRCPGEHLSMTFLKNLAIKIKKNKYKIYLIDGKSNKDMYIWGEIDRNLVINLI